MPYFDQYGPDWDMQGGNAARDFERYRGSEDFGRSPPTGWQSSGQPGQNPFERLLSLFNKQRGPGPGQSNRPGQISSTPLPPPPVDPFSLPVGSPFGGPQQQQQQPIAPQARPVSQLDSARTIMRRINEMLGQPSNEPPPVDFSSFFPPVPPEQLPRFDAQQPSRQPSRYPGSVNDAVRNSPFDYLNMGPPNPRQRIPLRSADGGEVPGFMRGGYPELYNRPVRHFDSGGESYVGGDYGDANGREDNINARLSPREYVMDAETMALLGDGNPDDGAKKMDTLRANIRKHKGKALAKGKISPNAKAASSYIAGNPMSDGIRRAGLKT